MVLVPTTTHINKGNLHGPTNVSGVAREPEILPWKDIITVGSACDFRARSSGSTISIVVRLMNFGFGHISGQM